MKEALHFAVVSALLVSFPSGVHAELLKRIERENTEHGYVSIHYPKSFDPAKKYHLLYWFHGTGGKPNPGISKIHDAYIGIGMSYLKRDHVPAGKYGDAHWKECLEIRKALESAGLKLNRDVVAGMSKGGWASFYIGAEVPSGPDAIAIFAAGKDPRLQDPPRMPKDLSVLVGTGETDPNYPQAQLAVLYFRKGGAQVAYEEWLGAGHTYRGSPRVAGWLDMESRKGDPTELKSTAMRHVSAELNKCQAILDPRERYLALRFLISDPHMPHVSNLLRDQVFEAGREASRLKELQPWLAQLKKLRALVRAEANFFDDRSFDVPKLKTLADRFRGLIDSAMDPGLAARAAYGAWRARKMFNIYKAQKRAFETPEYKSLTSRYAELQRAYSEADGKPGPEIMKELKKIGGKLGDLRFQASMSAFAHEERKRKPEPDPKVDSAIEADPRNRMRPYSGLGF